MKRFCISLLILLSSCVAVAQVSNENYIRIRRMLDATESSYVDDISYYDGLGRPFQNLQRAVRNGSSVNLNLVTLQEYDAAGRDGNRWLPVPAGSSLFLSPATFKAMAPAAYGNDSRPYAQPVYETSPLARATEQYGPGRPGTTLPVPSAAAT